MQPVMTGYKRVIYLALGWGLVALAGLGIVLPLLPTTPLLLLAVSCFLKSSERSRRWLLNSRLFGPILRDWYEHRAVRRPVKLLAFIVIAAVILFAYLRDLHWGIQGTILAMAVIGVSFLGRLPTRP